MRSKDSNKKRRHHHVWRSFLDAWTINGRIHCLSAGKIFSTSTINVAVEGDFYKLRELTQGDVDFIVAMIKAANPAAHAVSFNFLRNFIAPYQLRYHLAKLGQLTPEIDAEISLCIQNSEENYHTHIEQTAQKILKHLRAGSFSLLEQDEKHRVFSYFVALQFFRTKGMRERMQAGVPSGATYDFQRCWNILAHIFATTLGGSIYLERKTSQLTILENNTTVPFITSDQPVFNLQKAVGNKSKYFSLYYPVSPRYAVFIDDASNPLLINEKPLDEEQIVQLNDEMVSHAFSQVFSSSEEVLCRYINQHS